MEGFKYNIGDPQRGIIPRAIEEVLNIVSTGQETGSATKGSSSVLEDYGTGNNPLLSVNRVSMPFD